MTKAKISEYDAVAANNTDVNGVNIAEGCPPSGMNNMGREIMAALKRFQVGSDGDGVTVGGNLVVSGSSTLSTTSISSADINAGTIDGTAIGGSTPAAGSFTTLNTSGQVVFNDAGADVDFRVEGDTEPNLLFVDASADAVGIGTSSPTQLSGGRVVEITNNKTTGTTADNQDLIVKSVSRFSILSIIGASTGGSSLNFGDENDSDVGGVQYNHPSNYMVLNTNAQERMRIDSSGNVGIGATSPAGIFSVTTGTNIGAMFTRNANDDGTAASALNIATPGGTETRIGSSGPLTFLVGAVGTSAGLQTERMRIGSGGEVYFPGVGTTASAANAFLNSGSTPANQLLRSTSSIRYKTDVETLDPAKSEAILSFRPVWYRSLAEADRKDWSWYGLIAEEVAEIEPRLVHWSYPESEYEEVETEVEQERTVTDEDGNETTETYTETKTQRKLKDDAQLAPDGVQYDRLTVLLLDVVKRQDASIKALEARIAALENA